jgi:hypothetical protein
MTACIYALTDPADGRICYVGSTIYFSRRMKQHLYRPTNAHLCHMGKQVSQWVVSLLTAGRAPQGVILEEDPPNGLEPAEQRWIAQCLSQQEPLLNTPRRVRHQTRPWSKSLDRLMHLPSVPKPKPKSTRSREEEGPRR